MVGDLSAAQRGGGTDGLNESWRLTRMGQEKTSHTGSENGGRLVRGKDKIDLNSFIIAMSERAHHKGRGANLVKVSS